MNNIKLISILGSTGSIGTQALEVIREHPDYFKVVALTAGNNADLLITQALEFQPYLVVISNPEGYLKVKDALAGFPIRVESGENALIEAASLPSCDLVLTALVGFAGLKPTLAAIHAGKSIALANKETLVVAGEIVTQLALQNKVSILPVDSEHSAIFQCLVGEEQNPIEKIILTASGGPFRGKTSKDLESITKAQALKHPNWTMGAKITIDSATLMNKGLEVIEALWLFHLDPNQIEVIVHPQSILHSIVQFTDGSMKAQMGIPDMKLPIQYALGYPNRLKNKFPRFDFSNYPQLTFEPPDLETFPCLQLAFQAMNTGGNTPCILNAANEIAVESFLQDRIKFVDIPTFIEKAISHLPFIAQPDLNQLLQTDQETRKFVLSLRS